MSTSGPDPNASSSQTHVICVYTYDWNDEKDVWRIREELRRLGVTKKISYKTDDATNAGYYAANGHTRISKFYG